MPGAKGEEGADKGKEEEVPLTPVGEGAEDLQQSATAGGEEERRASGDGAAEREEEEHREDTRVGGDRHDDDDDRGKDPRDMTQREKRDRRRRARDRDRTELRYLRYRNEQLERSASENAKRMDRLEEGQAADKITRLRGALKNADVTIARLAAEGEAAQAVEATQLKSNLETQLRAEEQRLAEMKRGKEEREDPVQEERRRPSMPAEARRNLEDWYDRNPWFDAERPDTDSNVAMALDKAVMADGYDPRDPEYYEELDRRIADYMPHIGRRASRDRDDDRGRERGDRDDRIRDRDRDLEDRDDRRGERRGRERDDDRNRDRDRDRGGEGRNGARREARGPVFRVGGRDRPLRENEVYLSAERRKALEEMGAMDDPVLRNRYLKSFKKYDEEHPPSRRDR